MGSAATPDHSAAAGPARGRLRWHLVYYVLAAFDVCAVSFGLYLNYRISGIYARSLEANRWWTEQLGDYWDLEREARAVKAATNDIFLSRDVAGEVAKMRTARARFDRRTSRERAELRMAVASGEAQTLMRDLDQVEAAVETMAAEAAWLFAQFEPDRPQAVTERLATLERRYATIDEALVQLRDHATQMQRRHFAEQSARVVSLQQLNYVVAALILMMVTAATLYGRRLAREAQRAGADLEARVRERTSELDGANASLRASEERHRTLFDSSPLPMWVYDLEKLRFLAVNSATARHYGYSREALLDMTLEDIHPPDSLPRLRERVATIEPGPQSSGVWKHRKKDGTLIDVEITSHSLIFDGRSARLVLAHDITDRKLLEDQLRQAQKMEAVGQLAGGVAHDFNNILNIIIGYGELLRQRLAADEKLKKRLDEILKAAERGAGLTRQLLAFSRKQVLQPKVLDLNGAVAEMDKMLRRLIGEQVRLVTSLAPALGRVKADPGQMEQVMMNLAVNARDAMPSGGSLTLETANVVLDEAYAAQHLGVRAGAYVMLAVSDTGVGMDQATKSRIFEPFFTTKGPGKGTGLGLATVQGIVQQSGGHIWLYSEPGRGTTFKIYLPRVEGPEGATEAAAAETAPPAGSETILLVEDESQLRAMVRETLADSGYAVVDAADPEGALAAASSHSGRIHIMLTDVVMPGMSGPELAKRLNAVRPETRVLYMSGYTDEHIGHHGVLDAGTQFIQKPFSADALLRRLREILDAPGRSSLGAAGLPMS